MCSIIHDGGLERTSVSAWTGMDVSCTRHTTKSCSLLPYMALSVHCTDSSPSLMPEVRVTTIYTTNHTTKHYIWSHKWSQQNWSMPKFVDSILAHIFCCWMWYQAVFPIYWSHQQVRKIYMTTAIVEYDINSLNHTLLHEIYSSDNKYLCVCATLMVILVIRK